MIDWEEYLPDVLPFCNGCPEPYAIKAIRDAAIDFLSHAPLWKEELDAIPFATDQASYTLVISSDQSVVLIEYVKTDERTIYGQGDEVKDTIAPGFSNGWRDRQGTPTSFYMTDNTTIRFVPIPTELDNGDNFIPGAWLKPSRDSTEGPDFLFEDYGEAIGQGALSRLYNMKGRDWYDPAEAGVKSRAFRRERFNAKSKAHKGRTKAPNTVRMRTIHQRRFR